MSKGMFHEAEENDVEASRTVTLSSRDAQAIVRILSLFVRPKPSALERDLLQSKPLALVQDTVRDHPVKWNALVEAAQNEYRTRRSRSKLFDEAMFGEPAWDMLLALFINGRSGERLTVSRLLRFSGSSSTSGLRWLNYLENKELIQRESNPIDGRSAIISLSERGERALETYLSETLKSQS